MRSGELSLTFTPEELYSIYAQFAVYAEGDDERYALTADERSAVRKVAEALLAAGHADVRTDW